MANKDFVVKNSLIVGDTATINGVQIDPSGATSNQVLKFDGTKFSPAIPSVSILDDVGDVTITSASSGQVLQWNGSAWINATVSSDVMTDAKNAALIIMDIGS